MVSPGVVRTVAVTGPTGAGKSRFCTELVRLGATLIDADRVGHEVLDRPEIQQALSVTFGQEVRGADGSIDRGVLGALVFASRDRRRQLEALVHPALARACTDRLADAVSSGSPVVILEAAVYFLLPGPPAVDMTVTVTATAERRLDRLVEQGLAQDRARARMEAQDHLLAGWQGADRIIENDGTEADLQSAADEFWRDIVAPNTREG